MKPFTENRAIHASQIAWLSELQHTGRVMGTVLTALRQATMLVERDGERYKAQQAILIDAGYCLDAPERLPMAATRRDGFHLQRAS